MIGFYLLLLSYRVDPWLAIAGAIAYGFSSYFFILLTAGHNTKAMALSFMAPLIGSIVYAYRRDMLTGALLTAIVLSLEIISNHLQITYYALMILLIFGIFEFVYSIREKEIVKFLKTTFFLVAAAIIAVIINFASLYTTFEYGKYSIRGESELAASPEDKSSGVDRSYATHWSYGIDETFSLIIPNIKGGASKPFDNDSETVRALRQNNSSQYISQFYQYWGKQPGTSGPVYVGAIVVLLFIMALVLIKGRDKWWLLTATAIAIMLAWGKNFMFFTNLFMDFLPGYSKFRAVTTILIIVQFTMPLLGILVLDKIFKNEYNKREIFKALKISGGVTFGILALFLLFPGLAGSFISINEPQMPDWLNSALIADRKDMLRTDVLRSLFFGISAAVIIYFAVVKKLRKEFAILFIASLILIDMWSVDKRYLNNDNFVRKTEFNRDLNPTAADNIILQDKSTYRVLNLTVSPFNDGSTSYNHHSIGGYHGAKIRRYQDLIEHSILNEINTLATRLNSVTSIEDANSSFSGLNALNMLNTKYVIINPEASPLTNPNSLGNSWFVDSFTIVETPDDELSSILDINPATEAIVDKRFLGLIQGLSINSDSSDYIRLISYKPNEMIYESNASSQQLALFSEIYYPKGWNAYIDGERSDYFRANYVLRAMIIPEGKHQVTFKFEPESYIIGNKVSLAGSFILILLIILAGYYEIRRRKAIK
jgi:hypothetical protein